MNKNRMGRERKAITYLLVLSLVTLVLPPPQAWAGMVSTEQALRADRLQQQRAQVLSLLDRSQVQEQLVKWGVDPVQAKARVARLSDDQLASVAHRMDGLKAGGGDLIGAAVFIFVLLLVTDILGFTDVFPFTKSVR